MRQRANLAVLSGIRKKVLSETESLFGTTNDDDADSAMDFRFNIKQRLGLDAEAARRKGIDRAAIATRMSESTGRDISVYTLDGWLAESKEGRNLPHGFANAWAAATESTITLEYVMSQHPVLARRLRLGEIAEQQAVLEDEKRRVLELGAEVA